MAARRILTRQVARKTGSVLRVAAMCGNEVLAKAELEPGESLSLGSHAVDLVAKPAALPVPDCPVRAMSTGWEVNLEGASGGELKLGGQRIDPTASGRRTYSIGVGDHGVLTYGSFAVFFQRTGSAGAVRAPRSRRWVRQSSALIGVSLTMGGLALAYALMQGWLPGTLMGGFRVGAAPRTGTSSPSMPAVSGNPGLSELWAGGRANEIRAQLAAIGAAAGPNPGLPATKPSASAGAPTPLESLSGSDGLSPAEIRRVVMSQYSGFHGCYETGWGVSRGKELTVTVSWTVTPDGKVTGATIASSSPRDARVESCLLRELGRLHFPPSDQATHSSYTFTFRPNGQ